jgi:hypothetical protein
MRTADQAVHDLIDTNWQGDAAPKGVAEHLATGTFPTTSDVVGGIEKVAGKLPEPQSSLGKAIGTVAEFVPQAIFGGPAKQVVGRLMKYAMTPGLASEAAGRMAGEGSKNESIARFVGALAGGGVTAALSRESAAANTISKAFEHIPHADRAKYITGAYALMKDAEHEGPKLTWEEALKQSSGGRVDLNAQRVVEGSGRLRSFMGDRPGQVDAAMQRHLDAISEKTDQPSTIGPAAGEAATQHLTDVRTGINAQTRPDYQAAEQATAPGHVADALALNPVYQHALNQVRGDPLLNAGIEHLPDTSGAVIDRVKKRLGELRQNAKNPVGTEGQSALRATNAGQAQQAPKQVLDMASGGRYAKAELDQATLRAEHLDPLLSGPLGKMQGDPTTKAATEALFPSDPERIDPSGHEVEMAIKALQGQGQRGAWAARQLVRSYVEGVFSAAHKVVGDQFVGAKIANVLTTNPKVAERLASALNALPNGSAIAPGFQRLLEILSATGQRQRAGSMTSFNTEMMQDLKSNSGGLGGAGAAATKTIASAGLNLKSAIAKKFEQLTLGKNLDQFADLLVNPEAATRFRQLSEAPIGSSKALAITARLLAIAGQGIRHRTQATTDNVNR